MLGTLTAMIVVSAAVQDQPKTFWYICTAMYSRPGERGIGTKLVSEPFESEDLQLSWRGDRWWLPADAEATLKNYLLSKVSVPAENITIPDCKPYPTEKKARYAFDLYFNGTSSVYNDYNKRIVLPSSLLTPVRDKPTDKPVEKPPVVAEQANEIEGPPATQQIDDAARLRQEREAEFQAKLAAHKAGVEEYERKVAEREAEIARQQAQHAAAQEAAAREKAAYEAKMAVHRKQVKEAEAAQWRHMQCLSWNTQACDDIVAGKPASDIAEQQEASTDTDANQCVTTAEVRLNATFQGNTSASVMNGCGKPVDVRICLKRGSDWNCATKWGVGSQEQASHSSFNATGEVFVDAKTTGSARPLSSPD